MSVAKDSIPVSYFSVIDDDLPCGFHKRWTSDVDQLQSIDINPSAIIEIKPDDSDDEMYQLTAEENGQMLDSEYYCDNDNFSDGLPTNCVDDLIEINFDNDSELCTSMNLQTHHQMNDHNRKVDVPRFMELCDELEVAVVSIDQNGNVQPVDCESSEWQELLMTFSNDPLTTIHGEFGSVCVCRKDSSNEILSDKQSDSFDRASSPSYQACAGLGEICEVEDDLNVMLKAEVEDLDRSEANVWCSSQYLQNQIITVNALHNSSVCSTSTVKTADRKLSVAPSCHAVGLDFSDTDLSDHTIDVLNLSDDDLEVADDSDVDVDVEMFSDDGEQGASTRSITLPLNPHSQLGGKNDNTSSFFETYGVDSLSDLLRVINYFHNYSRPPQQQQYRVISRQHQQQQPSRTAGRKNAILSQRPVTGGGITNRRDVISTRVGKTAVERMRGSVTGRRRRRGGQRRYINLLYNESTSAAAAAAAASDDDYEEDDFGDCGRYLSKNAAAHNAKERQRRRELSSLFNSLMKELPTSSIATRKPCVSKIALLQAARRYIIVLEKTYLEKRQKLCSEMEDMQHLISNGELLRRRQIKDCNNKLLLQTLSNSRCMFNSYLRKV